MDNNRVTAEQMEILKEYVRFKDGNTKSPWSCTKCSHESTGRPNRIVAHLLGITGKGIRPCPGMKDEREDLARRLGRNSQLEQIVFPIEDTHSPGFLLDDLNDGAQDTERSPQLDFSLLFPPQGGMNMGTGDPMPTPPTSPQVQSAQLDLSQRFTGQGGMGMGAGDPQVNFDHMNDQYIHPSQDGVGSDTSTPGNAFGVGVAREPIFANPPPCPPHFPRDLWDLYVKVDDIPQNSLFRPKFALYKHCTSFFVERNTKNALDWLTSACSEVRNYFTNAPDNSDQEYLRKRLYNSFLSKARNYFNSSLHFVGGIEKKIRIQVEQEVRILGTRRKMEMNCWLGYVGHIKSDVSILDLDAMNAKSASEILPLLQRIEGLTKGVQKLIEMGLSLLNPVPKDLLSWNPSFMYCGSQLQNQMLPGQFSQQV